jgi:hypothetical protein
VVGPGAAGLELVASRIGLKSSIGIGSTIVVFFSVPISTRV